MSIFFRILNKIFFKTWVGISTIILNLLYVILLSFMHKGNLTQIVSLPFLIIISNSILLMPLIVIEIKKMSFIQKYFLTTKNRINNFLPIFLFLIINIIFYFVSIFLIILVNIKEKNLLNSFFSSINWLEFLFSLIIINLFCLFIGQLLFLYCFNIKIMTIISNFIFMIGIFLSGIFIPSEFLKKTIIIKELHLINPFTYLNNLLINSLTANGNEFVNLEKGGIFDFTKDFVIKHEINDEYIVFTKNTKIYNLLVPILFVIIIFFITSFKKIELEFNSKNIFFNNFKKTKIINKNSNKLIEINNLCKTFKQQIIFKNASLTINKNDIIGIIGKNGIGKTTLFKIIIGSGNADDGTINYNFNYKNVPAEKMNFLFQNSAYPKELKIKDILNSYIYKNTDLIAFNKFKKMLNIQKIWNKKPKVLSGGEKQKISLLIAILDKPDILFLDEFTSNLDIEAKFEVSKYLKKYFEKTNTACILITHDIHILQKFCNKVILLKNKNFQIIPQKDINQEKIVKYFNLD